MGENIQLQEDPRFQVHPMMSPADREGRAFVHYTAWKETYTGLMPEGILAAHTLERCRERAEKSCPDSSFVVLDRENGDRVAGFATVYPRARDFVSVPDADEIRALYVLREYQGLGLGRMLMEHCLACLHRPRVALFVLEGNERAIGFYKHMGFRLTGQVVEQQIAGAAITELEMVLEREQ
jgi:ribosomal protein S18 acetylase RimI-like enzyme